MSERQPRFVGVDGSPDGWVAVRYDDEFVDVVQYKNAEELWDANDGAETILIDVPIGMREDSADARECDTAARALLSPDRHTSVFAVPVRDAVKKESYEEAKEIQEAKTDGSLGTQSYAIADKIRELDELLNTRTDCEGIIRESHPEVCFCALNDDEPMGFSKTSQPAAAFWERLSVLESVDENVLEAISEAGETVASWNVPECSNDDLLDAFALALTASDLTGGLETLPADPEEDDKQLSMEIVYASPGS